ncbi:hypothetical protein WJX74_000806 [Apatococcus lobatus]|uniref:Uncharacterized protein n=1 Tax=Apatococcus lobatus TaxID=904363 RepID=A0AAW1RGZ2_9CHLO
MADPALEGLLFRYGPGAAHTAFLTGSGDRHVVLIGGLSNGLLFAGYNAALAKSLQSSGWAVVLTLLSSSLKGWGIACLDQDAAEIKLLTQTLTEKFKSKGIVLAGHSTGCQDVVRYVTKEGVENIAGAILQAAVSDREWLDGRPETKARLKQAEDMIASGKGEYIAYRDFDIDGAPICARRCVALAKLGGDDDMFSSDFSDDMLKEKIGAMASIPTLIIQGLEDETVPASVDKRATLPRLAKAAGPHAITAFVEHGVHDLTGCEEEYVRLVKDFLAKV